MNEAAIDYYLIYRAASDSSEYSTRIGSSTTTTFTDTLALPGKTYYYWIKACDVNQRCSALSTSDSGWSLLEEVTNLQASDGTSEDHVSLSWDPVNGATRYVINRNTTNSAPWWHLAEVTGESHDDTSADVGTEYYYRVEACTDDRCSSASASDTGWRNIAPATILSASDGEYDQVSLSWDPVGSADHYEVYRAESSGGAKTTLESNQSGAAYVDTSMTPGDTYYYWVKACVSICSDFSGEDSGWARGGTLPVVTDIRRADPNPTQQDQVAFTVEFNKNVENVDSSDFVLTTTGISGGSIVSVTSVTAAQWTVEVDTGSGSGTIRLDLLDDNSIVDLDVGNELGGPGSGDGDFTTGEVYTVDKEAPSLTAIERDNPVEESTNADILVFLVEFSEDVQSVTEDDFSINGGSTAVISIVNQVSASIYKVRVSEGDLADYNGTVGIDLSETQDIVDDAGNPLAQDEPETDEIYLIDNVAPTVSLAADAEPGGTIVLLEGPWQPEIVFDENVLHDGSDQAADNADNYLLFQAGLNGQYDITSCAEAADGQTGDDILIPVGPAVYDDNNGEGPFVTTLTVNNGVDLPLGEYRFMVCGTTSIADLAGNILNDSGSDAVVTVSVVRQYLFPIWFH